MGRMNTEALRKILDIEKQRGYVNSAVIGGLDKFLENWSVQAAESMPNPQQLARFRELFKTVYAAMSREKRRDWITGVLAFLDESGDDDSHPAEAVAGKPRKAAPVSRKKVAARPEKEPSPAAVQRS